MLVMDDGEKTEIIGAARSVTVQGDDTLQVDGKRQVTVQGDHEITAANIKHVANNTHVVGGSVVKLASQSASQPGVKGTALVELLSSLQVVDGTGNVSTPSPAWLAQVARILSNKVFLE